jgi:hypothetical protein
MDEPFFNEFVENINRISESIKSNNVTLSEDIDVLMKEIDAHSRSIKTLSLLSHDELDEFKNTFLSKYANLLELLLAEKGRLFKLSQEKHNLMHQLNEASSLIVAKRTYLEGQAEGWNNQKIVSANKRSDIARKAANAKHDIPGGNRDKRKEIKKIYESNGEVFDSKHKFADQYHEAVGMGYGTARKAIKTPKTPKTTK